MEPWTPNPDLPVVARPGPREIRQGKATGLYADKWYWLAGPMQLPVDESQWQRFRPEEEVMLSRAYWLGKSKTGCIGQVGPPERRYEVFAAATSEAITLCNKKALAGNLATGAYGDKAIAGLSVSFWSVSEKV